MPQRGIRAVAPWLLLAAAAAPVWSLLLRRQDYAGTRVIYELNPGDDYLYSNSSMIGLSRKSVSELLYTHQVAGTLHIKDNDVTMLNYSGAVIYRINEFGPATLDFDGEQILLRDKDVLTGLMLISGWARTNMSGETDIIQQTGRIGSKVFIRGEPYYNGSHILVQANGKQVACYRAPGFPVITKTTVTIQRLAGGGDTGSASAHAIAPSPVVGQMVGCTLHQAVIEPKLIRLFDQSKALCTALSLGSDIMQLTVFNSTINIIGSGGSNGLAVLDANVTGVRHNGTHVVFQTNDDMLTISPNSGVVFLSEGNSRARINDTSGLSIDAELAQHDGIRFNGTHLTLGDAGSFYTPGRLRVRAGSSALVVDDRDGSVKADVEVTGQATVRKGSVEFGHPPSQDSAVFLANGLPQLTAGVVTIRNPLGNVTAEILCNCSTAFFNGSQIDLFSGGHAVVSVHAVGAAVLDGTILAVVGEDNSAVATITVGLIIYISKVSVTFADTTGVTIAEVVRQGLPLYNGSHLVVTREDGMDTLTIGLSTGPHIGTNGARFGDESNCTAQPCLTVGIWGPFYYNGSVITLSDGDDSAMFKAAASSITVASGILHFLSSRDNILATIDYAHNATVYLDDKSASLLETVAWTGDCNSALASSRHSGRPTAGTLDLRGQSRVFNGSHIIIRDEDRLQDILVQAVGDLVLDIASQSCCIVNKGQRQLRMGLAFNVSGYAQLDSEYLTIISGDVTYNLSALGLPIYNDSRVDVYHDGRVTASITVSSFVTLLDSSILFRSESGNVLLAVAINGSESVVLSNGTMDVLASGRSISMCRLVVGHARVHYAHSHLELTSTHMSIQATIKYRSAVARVSEGKILVSTAGERNITIDLRGVPHFQGGSVKIAGDQVAFTTEAPSGRLICKRRACWLAERDGKIMLEIDTAEAFPVFSTRSLTIAAAASTVAATNPYLTADVQSKLRFNGTVMTNDELIYDLEVEGEVVYNGSSVLLVSTEPLAKIMDIEYVSMTSEGIIFSSNDTQKLVLPAATSTRIDTCKAAGSVTESSITNCLISQLNGIYALGGVNVSMDLYGRVVIENGTAKISRSTDWPKPTFSIDGLGTFDFAGNELILPATERMAGALSIGCSGAVPRFSRHGVDFVGNAGAMPISVRTSAAVPRYNCTHIVLDDFGGQDEGGSLRHTRLLGTFAVSGTLRHDGSTTLSLVGADGTTVAIIADIQSLRFGEGVIRASERDGGEVAALLCAPGDVIYDGRGLVSVLNGSGHGMAVLSVGGSTPAFARGQATFAGTQSNLTIELSDRMLVVDSGKSISVGGTLFKIAGKPVDDGNRLRIVADNDSTVLAEIAYGGMPLFVNGSVVYLDANDPSSAVVVKNTGRPYVYLRARDEDGLLLTGALGNGTVASSWIAARPDNVSTGALRLLQRSDRLAFNGTHLAVYGENSTGSGGGVGHPLALIALARQRLQPIVSGESGPCGEAATTTTGAYTYIREDGATTSSSSSLQPSTPCWPLAVGMKSCDETPLNTDGTPLTTDETPLTTETANTSAESESSRIQNQTKTTFQPPSSSACQPPMLPQVAVAIVPVLGDDCVMNFLEDGQALVASVQLPDGCRLTVSPTGDVSIEDDAGVLAMSLNATKASALSAGDGLAVLRDGAGEPLLTAHYKPGVHRLDGDSVRILRPDGSSAIVVHTTPAASATAAAAASEVRVSCRDGTVNMSGGGLGNDSLAVDLRLSATALSAYVNGTTVALRDRAGVVHAIFVVPDGNKPSMLLNASGSSLSVASASPSSSNGTAMTLTFDLGSRGVPQPVYNGSHLVVLDAADGSLLAAVTAASDAGRAAEQESRDGDLAEVLWSMVRDPPRQRLSVIGVPDRAASAAVVADGNETALVTFRNRHTGKVTAELDFGAADGVGLSSPEAAPALVLQDELGRGTAALRVNGSLVIVDGSHMEYLDASGAAVAMVRFDHGGWSSSSNGTHVSVRSSSGNVLAVVGAQGAPNRATADLLCPRSSGAGNDTSVSDISRRRSNHSSTGGTTVEHASDFEALTFPGGPSGAAIVVCLRPEAVTRRNGSHWLVTSGNDTRFVVPIPELTTQAEATTATIAATTDGVQSSADRLFTAGPSFSPAVGPIIEMPAGEAGGGLAPVVAGNDGGIGSTVATRFVFIVMLTVCCIFLVGAAAMYVIMHWSNREHDYILSTN